MTVQYRNIGINATLFDIFQLNSLTYHEHNVIDSYITNFKHVQIRHSPFATNGIGIHE